MGFSKDAKSPRRCPRCPSDVLQLNSIFHIRAPPVSFLKSHSPPRGRAPSSQEVSDNQSEKPVGTIMEYHRTYPASRRASSPPLPPKVHLDEEPGQATPRRRVSVAVSSLRYLTWTTLTTKCARCRKRKIRCSGDPGDGSGCQNCRSAGADLRECRFARVSPANVKLFLGLG